MFDVGDVDFLLEEGAACENGDFLAVDVDGFVFDDGVNTGFGLFQGFDGLLPRVFGNQITL